VSKLASIAPLSRAGETPALPGVNIFENILAWFQERRRQLSQSRFLDQVGLAVFATIVSTNGAVYGPGHCGLTKQR